MTSISASGERNTWGFRVINEDVSQVAGAVVKTCKGCPSLIKIHRPVGWIRIGDWHECTLLHSVLQADLHPVCGKGREEKE